MSRSSDACRARPVSYTHLDVYKRQLVVRASGTEPRVRVMIEGPDQREMDRDVYALSKLIEHELRG